MSKQEFLDTLRRALARELSESEVADNINYYWNYIEQQVASGKSEEQVLSELGDPRLIARTILQVDQQKEEAADPYYQNTVYTEDEPSGSYRQDVEMCIRDRYQVAKRLLVHHTANNCTSIRLDIGRSVNIWRDRTLR